MNPQERLLSVLQAPHVSEKTARASKYNQYAFSVRTDATKPEIKAAVEWLFKVKVTQVQTVNLPAKKKRYKQQTGTRGGLRKAYVTLSAGQSIEFLGEGKQG